MAWLRDIATDLRASLLFATRVPLHHPAPITGADVARASWALPVVGLIVGGIAALAFAIAHRLGLPPLVAAALGVAAALLATGGLHEDGLADTCDGFGGGADRARKLEIMRDSRIGTYGACALALSLVVRSGALAALATPSEAAFGLIAAHAGARAVLPAFLRWVPPARPDGLAADAGRPSAGGTTAAAGLGFVVLVMSLGVGRALVAALLLFGTFGFMRALALRQIGGQTGDTAGALEQIGEIVVLLTAAAGHG
jgi:adenosylcobinamide-GDP ribazoletransferase